MFGFLSPSLEERGWLVAQNKKIWWIMPLSLGAVLFIPQVFSFAHQAFWGILITNILMRMWIHKAFELQKFNNIVIYKIVDSISYGLILGYAVAAILSIFAG